MISKAILSLAILLFALSSPLAAQNLVPDSSFEDITTPYCGITQSATQFNGFFNQWNCPASGAGEQYSLLVDTTCYNHASNGSPSGPIPPKGYQSPRTGDVHIGLYLYTINGLEQREYVQSALSQPLVPGQRYEVTFFTSLADEIEWATSSLGIYFSETPISMPSTSAALPFTPQVEATAILDDTSAWMMVRDTIVAGGSWEYLVIGNFNNDANTVLASNPGSAQGAGQYGAYYFIDDVSVRSLGPSTSLEREIGRGTVHVPGRYHVGQSAPLQPQFSRGGEVLEFRVYDISGRIVYSGSGEGVEWEGAGASPGIYIWDLQWRDGLGLIRQDVGKTLLTR